MASYTDSIKVKISEKFKPPPRISLAFTYAQRIKINNQIQSNIPDYNFSTETCILQKMKEWRESKLSFLKERHSKIELKRHQLEESKKVALEEVQVTSGCMSISSSDCVSKDSQTNMVYTKPNSSILMPTQASDYSNILKPMQLSSFSKPLSNREVDKKSTFNLSDFDYDTSSPFDNMELKSINDLEELAQVLNQEDIDQRSKMNQSVYLPTALESFQTNVSQVSHDNYNFPLSYAGNQYLSNIPNTASSVRPNNANAIYSNGYRYPTDFIQINQYNTPYTWTKLNNDYTTLQSGNVETNKSNCKSVPDVNDLEIEIEKSHTSGPAYSKSFDRNKTNVEENVSKSDYEVKSVHKKTANEDKLLNFLTKEEQDLCKSISIMGFPIGRVARVFRLLGNDEKKIVEHLLAMSDLLDLGFHEKDISNALFECDNDRDKALDKLIT